MIRLVSRVGIVVLGSALLWSGAYAQNLVQNPSFAQGMTGWTPSSYYDVYTLNSGGHPPDLNGYLRIYTAGSYGGIFAADQYIPVSTGVVYDVSGWINTSAVSQAALLVAWKKADGNWTSPTADVVGSIISGPTNGWTLQSATLTAPALAVQARIRIIAQISSTYPLTFAYAEADDIFFGVRNKAPVAEAGAPQSLIDSNDDGSEAVTLDGSGSYDLDGSLVRFDWKKNGQLLASGESVAVNLPVGPHTITLEVEDNAGATSVDSTTVLVSSPPTPTPTATQTPTPTATSPVPQPTEAPSPSPTPSDDNLCDNFGPTSISGRPQDAVVLGKAFVAKVSYRRCENTAEASLQLQLLLSGKGTLSCALPPLALGSQSLEYQIEVQGTLPRKLAALKRITLKIGDSVGNMAEVSQKVLKAIKKGPVSRIIKKLSDPKICASLRPKVCLIQGSAPVCFGGVEPLTGAASFLRDRAETRGKAVISDNSLSLSE